jgi:hypothetical protein
MAYLSEENTETYRRMLSADTERGPGNGFAIAPNPTTQTTTSPAFVKRNFGQVGQPIKKQITVTGTTTAQGVGGGTSEVAVKAPKTFQQAAAAMAMQPEPEKTNFMPLVYIGGAGLLLYFLFKK